jgi:hypothetical protein
MHGSAATDDLLDLYSNRPFGKVRTALREMRCRLQPMFDACPDVVTTLAKLDGLIDGQCLDVILSP